MKRRRERKTEIDDKGFSLIELVIVMTIMAVLVGIVGMQVIPYIQKARQAKDIQQVSAYCTDAMTAYTSSAAGLGETEIYTITAVKGASGWTVEAKDSGGNANQTLKKEFLEMNHMDTDGPDFQSGEGKKINRITIVCKNAKPSVSLTVTGPKNPDEFSVEAK